MSFVCLIEIHLHFPENGSLKGKRKEIVSLNAQLQRRFGAAVLSLRKAAFLVGALAVAVAFPRVSAARGFGWRESLLAAAGLRVAGTWGGLDGSPYALSSRRMIVAAEGHHDGGRRSECYWPPSART